jgi:ribose transport system ATP-binding protein
MAPVANGMRALRASGLTKQFGETLALDDVDLALDFGKVTGLVGENGAGKSTLLNILSGIAPPDAGSIEICGKTAVLKDYSQAQSLGIARVFQEQALIGTIPVYQNLLLGSEGRFTKYGQLLMRREMIALAQQMVDMAGVNVDVRRTTNDLSFSERQLVEIVRACMGPAAVMGVANPIVLLDEPTASLEKKDELVFFDLIARIKQNGGSLLFVSHRLTEVLGICDEVVVLKDGRRVGEVHPAGATERQLHRLMVGRDRDRDYYNERDQRDISGSGNALAVRNLSRQGAYHSVSFEVREGEILGIGGLIASGKSALGKGLAGIERPATGEVRLAGGSWERPHIGRLLRQGVGYVPAERLLEGMIGSLAIAWNITLASGGDIFSTRLGVWRHRLESEVSASLIERLHIRARSPYQQCSLLSGGNQQKVVLARWLARSIRVLILDNPTRGIDAGAKEEIYQLIRQLTGQGVAIILITDELLELIGLSNNIAIMRSGAIRAVIPAPVDNKPSEQQLVALMLSAEAGERLEDVA